MTAPNSVASEAGVPEQAISHDGHDGPDKVSHETDVDVQQQEHDDVDEASSPTSDDKPAQDVTIAQTNDDADDDSSGASSKDTSVAPADADTPEEVAANTSSAPPLPNEPLPPVEDDGWDCHWDPTQQAWFFHNRITNESTWDNPRVPSKEPAPTDPNVQLQTPPATAVPPLNEQLPAGGYNPAIHGDYDPNAWYAKNNQADGEPDAAVMDPATAYAAIGSFNRFTGRWQGDDQNPERHNDEAKSRRQMNAFFDVDAAANAHDGRSLKAERSGKKPSKAELKQFKEKRRAKKEEKRRAWLRD
ncbi:hypothetical protein F5Y07DRAFT_232341 [Xylaria sp. FL0933]|nr:hypothetical protein F5Y07DRAFT_232341 [Xylaria sp. FL0933]